MELWLGIAIGCEVGVAVVAIALYYLPLSWRSSRVRVEVPLEAKELFDLPRLEVIDSNFSVVVDHTLVIPEFKIPDSKDSKTCPTCGLVLSEDDLSDHLSTSGHGKPKDSPTFAVKVGSPYDSEDNTPGPGLYRIVLKSGERLPNWVEHADRPVSVQTEGETIVYWFRWDGLRRVH